MGMQVKLGDSYGCCRGSEGELVDLATGLYVDFGDNACPEGHTGKFLDVEILVGLENE